MLIKICSICNKEYEATTEYFYKDKSKIDGFRSDCKICRKNIDKNRYKENKEIVSLQRKDYYKNNNEKIKNKRKNYYIHNKEKVKIINKTYRLSHKSNYKCYENKRRAIKKQVLNNFTKEEWIKCLEYFDYCDAYTGLKMIVPSIDHIIPLSKGGSHTKNNIIPCEFSVNSSKHDNDFLFWFRSQEFYSKEREDNILNYINK